MDSKATLEHPILCNTQLEKQQVIIPISLYIGSLVFKNKN